VSNRLGRMLLLYRASEDIGIRAAAAEIGTSAATLSRIERGYSFDVETAMKLLVWLTRTSRKPPTRQK
jgi:transcriptional regulator with XRE-family HTH domain